MNLKDKCAEDGITLAEGKEKYGLTHWNQAVPEIVEADVEIIEEPIETESKEETVEVSALPPCPCSMEDLALSILIHGKGSPVLAWKDLL